MAGSTGPSAARLAREHLGLSQQVAVDLRRQLHGKLDRLIRREPVDAEQQLRGIQTIADTTNGISDRRRRGLVGK